MKIGLLALLSLLLSTALVVGFIRPVAASLPVHNINTGLDYATIQEAINAPQTLNGHTILVDAGTYYEHVVVNKPLTLKGADSDITIIDGSGTGIVVRSNVSDVEIKGFTIQNGGESPQSGIQIASCIRNTIRDCVIRNNGLGIYLHKSNDSVIVGNKIVDSSWVGIYVRDSNNNDIHDNIIADNVWLGGIYIATLSSTFNKLCRNNFINNSMNAQSLGSNTKWDNGAEGNYWDDYSGVDSNGDGIGDTSYTFFNDVDEYPLMEPWSLFRTFPVPWDGQTYYVTTFCNATVASFRFNQSLSQISFNVTGPPEAIGFCNVTIPNTLLGGEFTVLVNESSIYYILNSNATHNSLYFTIEFQSTSKVQITATEVGSIITVSVNPSTVTVGSEVTINGTITPVRLGVNVTISYRLSSGTWSTLATVKTDSNSRYTYIWTTNETGTYKIKTSWEGDSNTLPSESETLTIKVSMPQVVFPVTVDGLQFNVAIESSSTVSDFYFRKEAMEISFNVTGPSGTLGFCNVTIPMDLMKGPWLILVGIVETSYNQSSNGTHTFLYFTYTHTTHNIKIRGTWVVPEFPSWIAWISVIAITSLAVFFSCRKRRCKFP